MYSNIAWLGVAFLAFAVIHSLTAGERLKSALRRYAPARAVEGWYRLGYNALSAATFLPVIWLLLWLPDRQLYSLGQPWSILLRAVQVIGVAGLIWALISIDFLRFAGLSQLWVWLEGGQLPLPGEPLQEGGIYSWIRHPLYLFSLMVLWPTPVMTLNYLTTVVFATLYFVAGSVIEEHRLVRTFGERYEQYRRKVPWMIPGTRRR